MDQNPISKWSGVVALVIAILAIILIVSSPRGTTGSEKTGYGNVVDTSYFDIFDATTAYKVAGTIFYSATNGLNSAFGQLYSYTSATTTTATTQTLIVSDVQGFDTVILTPNVGSDTLTLFASSTASAWLPTAGNTQKTCFVNGTTTAGVNLTFAGGTGTKLLVASSSATALGSLNIGPQKEGCFTFTRADATATTFDILASFVSYL